MLGKAQSSVAKINVTAVVDICTILFIGSSLVFLFCSKLRSCVHVRCQLPHKIKQLFNPLFTAGGSHVLSQNSISPAYRPSSPIPLPPHAAGPPDARTPNSAAWARRNPIKEPRRAPSGCTSRVPNGGAVWCCTRRLVTERQPRNHGPLRRENRPQHHRPDRSN